MEWSGRAPAPPASEVARGAKTRSTLIGIDIGKNSFHGHDKRGAIMLRQNWSRGQARLANLPPCLIS
jgi:hypothetical protein